MLKKTYTKTGRICRVTFSLPGEVGAKKASICGEFNDWDPKGVPMKPLKNGGFSVTLSLPTGRAFRFRYRLDGERWENDWKADRYVPNDFGTTDSVVDV